MNNKKKKVYGKQAKRKKNAASPASPSLKYADGGFAWEGENTGAAIGALGGMAGGILSDLGQPESIMERPKKGFSIAGGALTGAAAGASFGPIGAAAGAVIGTIGGVIGANKQQKAYEKYQRQLGERNFDILEQSTNTNTAGAYGMTSRFPFMQDGGELPFESVQSFYQDYLQSPKFKERASKFYKYPGYISRQRSEAASNVKYDPFTTTEGRGTRFISDEQAVRYNTNSPREYDTSSEDIISHEFGHAFNAPGNRNKALRLTGGEENYIFSRNKNVPDWLRKDIGNKPIGNYFSDDSAWHDIMPSETKSDIDAFRYQLQQNKLYDTGTQDFNQDFLNKARKHKGLKSSATFKRLQENFGDKDLIDIMNTIAMDQQPQDNIQMAKNGGHVIPEGYHRMPDGNLMRDEDMYEDGGIYIKPENRGKFTASANRADMGVQEFASHVLANKEDYSSTQVKRANFARNAAKWQHEDGGYYADGGNVQNPILGNDFLPTINIEQGEMLVDFNKRGGSGEIVSKYYNDKEKFNGINPMTGEKYQPHAKGKKAEPQSNFTLVPEDGQFVISKKYAKNYDRAYKENDKVTMGTIKLNIENDNMKKGEMQKAGKMKLGGYLPKYADGGRIENLPEMIGKGVATYQDPITTPLMYADSKAVTPNLGSTIKGKPVLFGEEQGSNLLGKLGTLAPSLYNLGRGMFGSEREEELVQPSSVYTKGVLENLPQDINFNPVIDRLMSERDAAIRRIEDSTSSPSVARANIQNIYSNTNRAISDAMLQGQQLQNQIRGQRAGIYGGLAGQDVQSQLYTQQANLGIKQMNAQNRAAVESMIGQGLTGISDYTQMQQLNENQRKADVLRMGALRDMFSRYKLAPQTQQAILDSDIDAAGLEALIKNGLFQFNKG